MAVYPGPGGWDLIASGDSTGIPDVRLESGRDYRIEVELPIAVPSGAVTDWAAQSLAATLGAFMNVSSVRIEGALIVIEGTG